MVLTIRRLTIRVNLPSLLLALYCIIRDYPNAAREIDQDIALLGLRRTPF